MFLASFLLAATAAAPSQEATASLDVPVRQARLGDLLEARLSVTGPPGSTLDTPEPHTDVPEVAFAGGAWSAPEDFPGGRRFTWVGKIAAYAIGDVTVPPVSVAVVSGGRRIEARTAAVALAVAGALAEPPPTGSGKGPEIADIKPPETLPPDWGPLRRAAVALVGLLAAAGVAWWLARRYAARLRAVPAPEDPFRRMPPHVWVYEELGRLLERRLAESGQVEQFFEELSRIFKLYLAGRYRVDLLERTTDEVPAVLEEAGSGPVSRDARALLARCDAVKFAREAPGPEECRRAVEDVYRIVDQTKPAEPAQGAA